MFRHPPTLPPIPDLVWRLVICYLPPEELRRLYSVNRPLFHLFMEERYRSICFSKGDRKMKWLCKNIKNTLVKPYVRRIEIRPWHVECRVVERGCWNIWGHFLQWVSHAEDQLSRSADEAYAQRKAAKAIKRINKAVKDLPNVQEYRIQCRQGTCLTSFVGGLIPALTNWKYGLTKLTLCVPPDKLSGLARVELYRLESLDLVFWTAALEWDYFRFMVLNPLVVFVNNLYRTLQSLSVSATKCAGDVDLALLFKSLGTFPRMRNFELSMPYDGSSLSSIGPLLSFMAKQKGIQSFKLSTTPVARRAVPTSTELKEWIPGILKAIDSSFGNIQDVSIALRPLKTKSTLAALIGFLTTHGQNLMSLSLTEDNSLGFQEVQEMLSTRTSYGFFHLQRLSLSVERLSVALFSFLAETFPNLKELEIGLTYILQGPELDTFNEELIEDQQRYWGWGLKLIRIPREPGTVLGPVLLHCIPSLENIYTLHQPDVNDY
ncbi:hypothetical protein AX15_000749 [Amanita polypyramis BW_CC]|nr:hypothetical protein AX15_000749 [Amanita polypyramis BW_CC]